MGKKLFHICHSRSTGTRQSTGVWHQFPMRSMLIATASKRHHFAAGWALIHPLKWFQGFFFFVSCNQLHFWCSDAVFVTLPQRAFLHTEVTSLLFSSDVSAAQTLPAANWREKSPLHQLTFNKLGYWTHLYLPIWISLYLLVILIVIIISSLIYITS